VLELIYPAIDLNGSQLVEVWYGIGLARFRFQIFGYLRVISRHEGQRPRIDSSTYQIDVVAAGAHTSSLRREHCCRKSSFAGGEGLDDSSLEIRVRVTLDRSSSDSASSSDDVSGSGAFTKLDNVASSSSMNKISNTLRLLR